MRSHTAAALKQTAQPGDGAVDEDKVICTTEAHMLRAIRLMQVEGFCAAQFDVGADLFGIEVMSLCHFERGHDGPHGHPPDEDER